MSIWFDCRVSHCLDAVSIRWRPPPQVLLSPNFEQIIVISDRTYRRHSSLPLEPSPHTIVNTLWFPPAWVNAFVSIALVAVEALCACIPIHPSAKYALRGIAAGSTSSSRAVVVAEEGQTYASSRSVHASLRLPSGVPCSQLSYKRQKLLHSFCRRGVKLHTLPVVVGLLVLVNLQFDRCRRNFVVLSVAVACKRSRPAL